MRDWPRIPWPTSVASTVHDGSALHAVSQDYVPRPRYDLTYESYENALTPSMDYRRRIR